MILEILLAVLALLCAQGIYRNLDVYLGKRTTFDALPEHLDEQTEIDAAFPDDSQYGTGWFGRTWKRLMKLTKPWEAFGPRSRFSWAKWRDTPTTLFAIKGAGRWRLERDYNAEQPDAVLEMALNDRRKVDKFPGWYLSRVQYWSRWHLAITYPFSVSGHVYWRDESVPAYPERPGDTTLRDLFNFYGPTHRDADKIYWILSFFLGGTFK